MTRDEIFSMTVDKAYNEGLKWESIEFLFRPHTVFELLIRSDFEGMKKKVYEWYCDDSPSAMPHRFRDKPHRQIKNIIRLEEFYLALKEKYKAK